MVGSVRRILLTAAAALALAMFGGVATASATTYYVTPAPGPGADCFTPATACFITNADSVGPGSEVVIEPGDYMVGNDQLSSLNTANFHGVAGQPRPRIFSTYAFAAWDLGLNASNMTLRHVELYTTGPTGITVNGTGTSTVEDVVIGATGSFGTGCTPAVRSGGSVTFKNSVCTGSTRGIGVTCVCGGSATIELRNVTAIGGTNGIAIESPDGAGSPTDYTATATNVIARHTGGAGADVRAQAGTTNADVAITLANSNYASENEATCATPPCTATVTNPGTGTNQTGAPVFVDAAAGDFHQVPASPTVDAGADDPANGTADIDGQQRDILTVDVVGDTTDIGADELGRATTTSVSCSPSSLTAGGVSTCTATVTDVAPPPLTAPTGTVAFSATGGGDLGAPSCLLAPTASAGQSSCSVTYRAALPGSHVVSAISPRDVLHEGSQGAAGLAVTAPAAAENPECAALRARLQMLKRKIKQADEPNRKAKLKKKRRSIRRRLAALGCA